MNFNDGQIKFIYGLLKLCRKTDTDKSRSNNITFQWVKRMFIAQKGTSLLSKIPMKLHHGLYNSVSIDRVDNRKGHTKTNCVLLTQAENYLKGGMNMCEFVPWLQYILSNKNRCALFQNKRICHTCKSFDIKDINHAIVIRRYNTMNNDTTKCRIDISALYKLITKTKGVDQIWGLHVNWNTGHNLVISFNRINHEKEWESRNIQLTIGKFSNMRNNYITNNECRFVLQKLQKNSNKWTKIHKTRSYGPMGVAPKNIIPRVKPINQRWKADIQKWVKQHHSRLKNPKIIICSRVFNFDVVCKSGHVFTTCYDSMERGLKQNGWCRYCSNKPIVSPTYINQMLRKSVLPFECVGKYQTSSKPINFVCTKCKTTFSRSWDNIMRNIRTNKGCIVCKRIDRERKAALCCKDTTPKKKCVKRISSSI